MTDLMDRTASGPTAVDSTAPELDRGADFAPVPARSIPTRRISFESRLRNVRKYFAADDDLLNSHLAVALSSVFPDGEDFFVRSVRHYRSRITDPELRKQVAGFIGQEATHGREHREFNDRLAELGYPTKENEWITRKGLELRSRIAPASSNLAATAALEHFTATMAEVLLTDGTLHELFGDDAVRDLFLWHALEECEHKAVAFDVYKAIGGGERMRVWTMVGLRYGFVVGMAVSMALAVAGDRNAYEKGRLRASWKRFKRNPLLQRSVWQRLKDYDRPDFHPDDHDTDALVAEWRERLFGDAGELNDQLASRPAERV
ncbi:MAG TPA: metal-dependent hydrolase [Microthrixaceae bacterium]|nr:metal-dependent hydrolase [Microthrixaceae bacterium]